MKSAFSILFLVLIWSCAVYAQKYNFIGYGVADGFPQSNADHVTQDSKGYMWFATQNGAVKFNGKEFETIGQKEGLISSVVQCVFEDSKGQLWVATKQGVTVFNKNKHFSLTKENGLYHNNVLKITEIDDYIYLSTQEGACIFRNSKIQKISPNIHVYSFTKMDNNEIWAGTLDGIYILKDSVLTKKQNLPKELNLPIERVLQDKNSKIWFQTFNNIFCLSNKDLKTFSTDNGLLNNKIDDIIIDSNNDVWYCSENGGAGRISEDEIINFTTDNGLISTSVICIYEDREKNIWFGTRNGPCMINLKTPFIHYDKISEDNDEIVLGINGDEQGNIWFCTYGYGAIKYKQGEFTNLGNAIGLNDDFVFDIEFDEKYIWLATANNGIVRVNKNDYSKFEIIQNPHPERVYSIFKDSNGNLWFGSNSSYVIKFNGNTFEKVGEKQGFKTPNIMNVFEDSDGNFWFSSASEGLFKFNGTEILSFNKKHNLKTNYLRCGTQVEEEMWFGSASYGLLKVINSGGKYKFEYITVDEGLSSNNIYLIYKDSKGHIWCGTDRGIDRITVKNGEITQIRNYGRTDGFFGIETNINGIYEDKNGHIWIGTVNGSTKYIPEMDIENTVQPNTYVLGLKLFFEEIDLRKYSQDYDEDGKPTKLIFPYNENHLSFEFIGLSYSLPDLVKYKYRLVGQSDKWSPPTSDRKAVFTNIAPGEYEFQVISANNDGVWNEKPTTLKIIIEPPFWQEIWFIALMIFTAILLTYIIVNWRISSLKRTKRILEKKVSDRTSEIVQQKEEIETQRNHTEEQKKIIEKIHREIEQSIVYATRIQQSVFPNDEVLQEHLAGHFVFFKAKDNVSGDFYWWSHVEGRTIITAADCTGHGVPGAFMSMLGISFLREIVQKEYITHPGVILRRLRKEIIKALKQTNEIGTHRDGMDMALVSIDHKNSTLQYAGANNPLLIVRKTENLLISELGEIVTEPLISSCNHNGNSLIEIKGDKMPISIYYKMDRFTNNEINIMKGDKIYLFSDGFADQFGGANGSKFKFKNFKKLLLENSHLPMHEQKEKLNETFYQWKGLLDQVDDLVVLGVVI
ncbi:MAG: SpoIIE family protein phosphatase [Bacteroidales bacterium]|nr:SpoIIE family protein phosphatase [Bacteroidales bacterium]